MRRRGPTAAAVLAGALACAAPAASAAAPLRSGPLAAIVSGGALTLVQPGGPTLRAPLSSLRLRRGGAWSRVRGIVGRRGGPRTLTLTLATDRGRRAELRLTASRSGAIDLDAGLTGAAASGVQLAFRAPRGERYFGFGERSNAVAQRATTVENYVSDGPFSAASLPIVKATIPPAGFRPRADATYYPVPWLLSSRGYGVLVTRDETSRFTLPGAGGGAWRVAVDAPRLALRVFAGPTPARALARFTAATGRQPPPAAPWAFGPWLQTGQPNAPPLDEQFADLEKLQRADAPVSAAETQLRFLPCGLDRGYESYEAERVDHYHRNGLAVLTYVNPMLCATYEPRFSNARAAGALLKDAGGAPSLFDSFVGGTGPAGFSIQQVGEYDFAAPAGVAAYRDVVQRMFEAHHDGWMEDFGEYTPLAARDARGRTGAALHNRYPVLYHCAVRRLTAATPTVRFQRSGWTGAARCADDVWGGDPTTVFGFDGLSSAVKQALSIGMSGVSRWGSDIGGYDTIGDDPRLTVELLKRWIAFGSVSGVMRIKKSGLAIPAYTRPQVWDPDVIDVWRKFTKLHTQLYPYLVAADRDYRRTGMPLMRALALAYPHDPRAADIQDEYLFGPDLLAAPVVRAGARSRGVYLPRGRWLDARRALRYDARGDGAWHAGAARALAGGRRVRVPAALDQLPLFVREGAVIPLLSADVSTLSDYGAGRVVRLADRRRRLRLLAFPGSRLLRHGAWGLHVSGPTARRYTLEASTAGLRPGGGTGFRTCAVSVNGRALPHSAWRQPRPGGVLLASFTARRARVTVSGCP
jgi:alpha-glucosidase (family GH31 glycosyl hydrolase)